jgi:histidinol dehydrogenase
VIVRRLNTGTSAGAEEVERFLLQVERGPEVEGREESCETTARRIVDEVRRRGDEAVAEYTSEFDGVELAPDRFEVGEAELRAAAANVRPRALLGSLRKAARRVEQFQKKTVPKSWKRTFKDGTVLGERITPIERVGVYVPGGRAYYPSSVLMTIIPARVAGCREIVAVSPPTCEGGTIHPVVLAAAEMAGATRVFRVGGAQAIAALAFGTDTIPQVDKIVGPGNIYVTMAKRAVSGRVAIDKEAGPSEVVIIADDSADARYVAADMLAQSEHDKLASAVLLTPSAKLADAVEPELARQLATLARSELARESLGRNGAIIVTKCLEEAVRLSNMRAPEHLELMVRDPDSLLEDVRNAGAVFLGENAPVPVGDYIAGPSHVLPTGAQARFASPLGVTDFCKRSSIVNYSKQRLEKDAKVIVRIAEAEGLDAHARAVRIRVE